MGNPGKHSCVMDIRVYLNKRYSVNYIPVHYFASNVWLFNYEQEITQHLFANVQLLVSNP